jgi:hypothetical protein
MHKWAGPSLESLRPGRWCLFLLSSLVLLAPYGCSESGATKQDYAYVSSAEAELQDRVAVIHSRTGSVHNADRVQILERMVNRRYVRVRSPRGDEGWIQERYLASQRTFDDLQHLAEQFKNAPAQATAVTTREVNLHTQPGRKTEHLYQLGQNEKLDLLQRQAVDRNAPPEGGASKGEKKDPDSEASTGAEQANTKPGQAPILEDWWLVRDSQKRVGWALGRLLYLDIPIEVAQYAEGQRIVAFFVLDQVQDGDKRVAEYLVLLTKNKEGLPYDYDQVRVFSWNVRKHRYETAFRVRSLDGFLPVTLGTEKFDKQGDLRTFTLHVADEAGSLHEQKYKFNPPIVSQVLAPGEAPVPRIHHRHVAKPRRRHA